LEFDDLGGFQPEFFYCALVTFSFKVAWVVCRQIETLTFGSEHIDCVLDRFFMPLMLCIAVLNR